MQLYLMRHGEAGYQAHSDKERTLTDAGRFQTAMMSHWLVRSVTHFDLVLVSPYVRAQQTWQEVAQHFAEPNEWIVLEELTPSNNASDTLDVVLAYAEQYEAENVLVIAHMPLLGYLVHAMLPHIEPPLFTTSGITLIEKSHESTFLVWQESPHSCCKIS
ncbi:phosphohistidine phosphatase SixA [Shewanella surugensis]|uniref:Phosphohistidine phosphatase SixA n=1 Tax=Shewanella surugensis TaxID=212020 RepID=A0ABT0LDU7_9GAMM|nr:phosphohistidine phosphatase SixA [Shewanella surugensis]MCL1125670.1 phosphohistidine phosphatase SixA [Shewanella surugensis]